MSRIKQRLNEETSKTSVNEDALLKIGLVGKEKLLPILDINRVVNSFDRFNVERQRSKYYRLIGTINPLVSNPLFNLSDSSKNNKYTWAGFNSYEFLDYSYPQDNDVNDDGDLTFSKSIKNYLLEKDGWFGYYDPNSLVSGLCNYIDMEPKRERFSFLVDITPFNSQQNTPPVKNWELVVTYPKYMDKNHKMVKGGLLLLDKQTVEISTKQMTSFGVGCEHNLQIGDSVKITGTNGYNGVHTVIGLGLNNGDNRNYYFILDLPNTGSITNTSRFKKIIDGAESEYYFRIFTKVKTRESEIIETDDYETYQPGFAENFFNDQIVQFVFNEDIDVSDLTDNLNRPLSELYLTMVKTDSNGLFSRVSSGIETPFIDNLNTSGINTYLRDVPAINKIHNGVNIPFTTFNPLEANVTINNNNSLVGNNSYYGDLVEYNINVLNETTLSVVQHRFNTFSRESTSPLNYVVAPTPINTPTAPPVTTLTNLGARQEGYFYKAHSLIKIREFSSYIEEGDAFTVGIPDYAVTMPDGRILWRDLLDIGFNDGKEKTLDYPFLNGVHNMYSNYIFSLKRQDQFGLWGMYHSRFPADPVGDRITDKFITKSSNTNVC
jgi:hypothetical protein